MVFAFFDRAFPRHALPLLPAAALLAASGLSRFRGKAHWALALAVLTAPAAGSIDLWRRSGRPSPADRALAWARSSIPAGSRVLQDQWTPRLDGEGFRVHRLQVEEQVFTGNFDWVFYSGYPPAIDVSRLREVQSFSTDDALGAAISVHQVPERAVLMGTTLAEGASSVDIGAGELPYFGEGFDPPTPGAYGVERLSRGASSEIFFVLPEGAEPGDSRTRAHHGRRRGAGWCRGRAERSFCWKFRSTRSRSSEDEGGGEGGALARGLEPGGASLRRDDENFPKKPRRCGPVLPDASHSLLKSRPSSLNSSSSPGFSASQEGPESSPSDGGLGDEGASVGARSAVVDSLGVDSAFVSPESLP